MYLIKTIPLLVNYNIINMNGNPEININNLMVVLLKEFGVLSAETLERKKFDIMIIQSKKIMVICYM